MLRRPSLIVTLWLAFAAPAAAVGAAVSPLEGHPVYAEAKARIAAGEYREAIPLLAQLRGEHPDEPDLLNWLGFCHRKLKDYPVSRTYYYRALMLDRYHLGANAYLGEWYVENGDLKRARELLDVLRLACGPTCAEFKELQAAIETAEAKG